jgi:hypothetical protein
MTGYDAGCKSGIHHNIEFYKILNSTMLSFISGIFAWPDIVFPAELRSVLISAQAIRWVTGPRNPMQMRSWQILMPPGRQATQPYVILPVLNVILLKKRKICSDLTRRGKLNILI